MHYLLQRYAGQIGYPIRVAENLMEAESIREAEPVAVIFAPVESLGNSQPLVMGLTDRDIPIIVCSSTTNQERMRELGADYCLLHPFGYDAFAAVLEGMRQK